MGLDAGPIANMYGAGIATGLLERDWAKRDATTAAQASELSSQRQMDFQREMSNTAYQRATADMKAAGLNPMLAYSQGGATTPGGSAYQAQMTRGTSFYNPAIAQTAAQIRNIDAQTDKIKAETQNEIDLNPNIRSDYGVKQRTIDLLRQQAITSASQQDLNEQETKLVFQKIRNAILEGERIVADTNNIKVNTVLRNLDVPRARNEAEAQKSEYMKNVAPYTGELGKLTNSAADLARARRGFSIK